MSRLKKEEKKCNVCGRVFKTPEDYLQKTSRWRLCAGKNLWFNCSCGSTLILPIGCYDWYDPAQFLSPEAKSVFNRLASKNEIPYLSATIMEVQQILTDPKASPKQIADSIRKDPILAAEILQVANNLRSPIGQTIHSIEHAITFIGIATVSEIVILAGVKLCKFKTKKYKASQFWHEAFLSGDIAIKLGQYLKLPNSDELYLAATLSCIGKMVGAICFPEETDAVYELTQNPKKPISWVLAEIMHGSIDHCILGEMAATLWGLPSYIADTARNHHKTSTFDEEAEMLSTSDVAVLATQFRMHALSQPLDINDSILKDLFHRIFKNNDETKRFMETVHNRSASLEQHTH